MAVPHFAFYFGAGHEGRHGVDDDDVDGAAAYQGVTDFQSLLAVIRLGDEEVVHIDTQTAGILRIQRMLCIDKGGVPAHFLRFRNHMQSDGGLAGRFRPVDFDDASPRDTAHTQGDVQRQGPGRDGFHVHFRARFAEAHDGAFAEVLLYLMHSAVKRPQFVIVCHK